MATVSTGRLGATVQARVLRLASELTDAGELHGSPATLALNGLTIATATDNGGKPINQDCVLLFTPNQPSPLRWAAAVADGVSSSLNSEAASSLACHAALASLTQAYCLRHRRAASSRSRLLDKFYACSHHFRSYFRRRARPEPLVAALRSLNRIGRMVRWSPERYRPETITNSSWRRVLRDGRYLQTTLMVIWQVDNQLRLEGVGDGGFSVQFSQFNEPLVYQPSADRPVDCLGPHRQPQELGYRMAFDRWLRLSVHTDGVTPALLNTPGLIPTTLDRVRTNQASTALRWIIRKRPDLVDDNLSLLLAKRTV